MSVSPSYCLATHLTLRGNKMAHDGSLVYSDCDGEWLYYQQSKLWNRRLDPCLGWRQYKHPMLNTHCLIPTKTPDEERSRIPSACLKNEMQKRVLWPAPLHSQTKDKKRVPSLGQNQLIFCFFLKCFREPRVCIVVYGIWTIAIIWRKVFPP